MVKIISPTQNPAERTLTSHHRKGKPCHPLPPLIKFPEILPPRLFGMQEGGIAYGRVKITTPSFNYFQNYAASIYPGYGQAMHA